MVQTMQMEVEVEVVEEEEGGLSTSLAAENSSSRPDDMQTTAKAKGSLPTVGPASTLFLAAAITTGHVPS